MAKSPTSVAVSATPTVASETACHSTGRTFLQSVSSPPEYRMITSATTPSPWATRALSK